MSGKREQALRIDPKTEIHFKGPYNRVVTEYFHLSNPTDKPIAFKVKTTAPKRYCVRPNNGTIAPGKSVQVAVMLQPLADGQNATAAAMEKNKHKFMIQSVFASSETGNADDMFKSVGPEDIMDSKFRCVFDDTANLAPALNNLTGVPVGKGLGAALGSESDGESGNDKDLTEAVTGHQRGASLPSDHDAEVSSSLFSAASVTATTAKDNLTNGGDDDFVATSGTNPRLPAAYTAASTGLSAGGDHVEVKRLQDENRELRVKLQDIERANRSGAGAYSRFAASQPQASKTSSTTATAPSTTSSINLLEQPLSGQVILTVLISLLIGFILGKVDLGLF